MPRGNKRNTLQICRAQKRIYYPGSKSDDADSKISQYIFYKSISGFDVADNEIVKQMDSGDLVITADIPLASEVIDEGGLALNPRGELYTRENVKSRLAMRDLMDTLRSGGVDTGGPAALNKKDIQAFANQLDRWLTKHMK